MARESGKCEGVFRGLFIRENRCGGILPAIERGECRVIKYTKNSKVPELLQFEEDIVNTFIQVDMLRGKRGFSR